MSTPLHSSPLVPSPCHPLSLQWDTKSRVVPWWCCSLQRGSAPVNLPINARLLFYHWLVPQHLSSPGLFQPKVVAATDMNVSRVVKPRFKALFVLFLFNSGHGRTKSLCVKPHFPPFTSSRQSLDSELLLDSLIIIPLRPTGNYSRLWGVRKYSAALSGYHGPFGCQVSGHVSHPGLPSSCRWIFNVSDVLEKVFQELLVWCCLAIQHSGHTFLHTHTHRRAHTQTYVIECACCCSFDWEQNSLWIPL